MTKKWKQYCKIQLSLIPCFYFSSGVHNHKMKRNKKQNNYDIAVKGLKKLNSRELEALNSVIMNMRKNNRSK